jgi:DNA invertase Pin-like site-specific DNA recombinase
MSALATPLLPITRKSKRAFSYIRFSDKKQAKGDSLRRQLEWGQDLCKAKGWTLDDSLKHDKGVSAFRGKNKGTGGLADFLEKIRMGMVRPGDVLLVESLDRLTREDIDSGWELFRLILKSGVEVVTREPEQHYIKSGLNELGTSVSVEAYLLRAYNESAVKSMRGKSYWQKMRVKQANGSPIHGPLPAWLRLSQDRKRFEKIPDAVRAVKLIYRWAGDGLRIKGMTYRLNSECVKPIGNNVRTEVFKNSWRRSYVAKLLRDRTVLGECQPHEMKAVPLDPDKPDGLSMQKRVPHGEPIQNYFPPIITENEWYAVRQAVKQRGKTRGRTGVGIASLFTGLIRDARDGHVMHMVYNGSSRKNNCRALLSYGVRNGERDSVRMPFPYDAVERAFLESVRELQPKDVLNGNVDDREEQIAALAGKLDELNEKVSTVEKRVLAEKRIDTLVSLLEKLDKDKKETSANLERLKSELANQQPEALEEVQSLSEFLHRSKGEELTALRMKIKARIKQLVSEVWMLVWDVTPTIRAAEIQITFHSGRIRGLVLQWLRRGKHRGLTTGIGGLLVPAGYMTPEEVIAYRQAWLNKRKINVAAMADPIPLLSDYKSNTKVRKWFEQQHETLGPAIQEVIAAEAKWREVNARVEAMRMKKGCESGLGNGFIRSAS